MQTYTLPREAFNLLLEALGGQQKAEVFAKSMESFLVAIENKATAEIVDKKEMIKIEVRDELRKELVTREIFDETLKSLRNEIRERFNVVDEKFKGVDEKFKGVDEKFKGVDEKFKGVDEKLKSLEDRMVEKFKSLDFKLNLFLAIALIALTFANPAFVELIKKIF
ncbi:hypothetical protein L0337_06875 [candidate division KSB1 bacterium]|nr:hypothetical protein [candidate division KSB1 bacterium]